MFQKLTFFITSEFPGINLEGFVGRLSSFEVSLDDKLLYSKLSDPESAYPDPTEVIQQLNEAMKA